ncbi:MAG TPA: leucyl aminopeptidase family protein [Paracoccaceae bacterium]|nr:leucyl aminopeptidase family protein [Paracoccaceae bacterium]
MPSRFAAETAGAIPLELVSQAECEARLGRLDAAGQAWASAQGFTGTLGSVLALPDAAGRLSRILVGWGDAAERARGRFHLAGAAAKLPAGAYRLETSLPREEAEEAALGWLMAGYVFDRYKAQKGLKAALVAPEGVDAGRLETIAEAAALAQDLINTPAADLGPRQLEEALLVLAARHGASARAVRGAELLEERFPMIHAVGRAADQEPRLLDLAWGRKEAPKVTLVGKGVCFDTGGLDIKSAEGMKLMRKDMGGAATVMGLAHMVMARGLDIRLRVIVPAVENAISGGAFRPGDILTSRKGLTVEVNNTDAEGRLVLADALALADEEAPALVLCLATLTGAARVALGPDLPPYYTDDEELAGEIAAAAAAARDPLWRMPLWPPYEELIEPGVADLDNAPSGGMAGSVTAALFLRRFVTAARAFAHIDIFAWTPVAKPGRPKGAAFQAGRALFQLLEARYGPA